MGRCLWTRVYAMSIIYTACINAFKIKKDDFNGIDLVTSDEIWLENATDVPENKIVPSKRIGIESAGAEVANKLYRFYELYNDNVSIRDKVNEQLLIVKNDGKSEYSIGC